MVKPFFLMMGVVMVMVLGTYLHYVAFDRSSVAEKLSVVVATTQIAEPSLSTSFYEPRRIGTESSGNIAYPEMMPIDRMDFVYAR